MGASLRAGGAGAWRAAGFARGRRRRFDLLVAMAADAEQALLQVAIGRQPHRLDHPVDAAVDHDGDRVGDLGRHADVLLDDEDGDIALLGQPHQHVLDLRDDDRREAFGRLVHDQEPRIEQQRPRDRQHLLLAAGELRAGIVLALGKPRKGVVDPLRRPAAARPALRQPQMLVDAQRSPQPPALRHIADAEPGDVGGGAADQFLAKRADRTARHRHQAHDRLAQRGFAHAVASDQAQHTVLQGQIDALQRVRAAVIQVQPANLQCRHRAAQWRTAVSAGHDRLRDKAPELPDRIRSRRTALP